MNRKALKSLSFLLCVLITFGCFPIIKANADINSSISRVISSGDNVFVIKSDGTVWGSGANNYGALGLGDTVDRHVLTQVPITGVKDVINSNMFTLFVKTDGTIWATGCNEYGQLGLGDTTNRYVPTQIPITNVKNIKTGANYVVFTKDDDTIWVTGANHCGQLGTGNKTNIHTPTKLSINNVKDIVVGAYHTVFIKTDNTVWVTGSNEDGQLGLGDTTDRTTPTELSITDIKEVIAGGFFTVFVKNDNTIWVTGSNNYGQLGLGDTTNRTNPTKLSITDVESIYTSNWNIFFMQTDGTLLGSGFNGWYQLGLDSGGEVISTPTILPISDVKEVYAGYRVTIIVKNDGTIWGCGNNYSGGLGIGEGKPTGISNFIHLWEPTQPTIAVATDKLAITNSDTNIYTIDKTEYQLNGGGWLTYSDMVTLDDGDYTIESKSTNSLGVESVTTSASVKVYVRALAEATSAVVKAEGSKVQSDIDSARLLVEALPDCTEKPDLTNRLNNIIVIKGSIVIKCLDENNNSIATDNVMNSLDLKDYTITAEALDGYSLNDIADKTVSITSDSLNQVVIFNYIKDVTTGGAVTVKGSVTVEYLDENSDKIQDNLVMSELDLKDYSIESKTLNGYTLNDDKSKDVTLTVDDKDITVKFYYIKDKANTGSGDVKTTTGGAVTVDLIGTITVKYVDEDGNKLDDNKIMDNLELKEYSIKAKSIGGYSLDGSGEKAVLLTIEDNTEVVTFRYKKDDEVIKEPTSTTPSAVVVVPTPSKVPSKTTSKSTSHHSHKTVKGYICIKYADENNIGTCEDTIMEDLDLMEYTLKAKVINGYDLKDTAEKKIILTEAENNQTIIFNYTKLRGCWKQLADGSWNFYDINGVKAKSQWINIQGTWYYMKADGIMATGWIQDSGSWYYTSLNGAMLTNTITPDGYYVALNGAWVK